MYGVLAISTGDSAAIVSAVAAVGLLLGSLHSRILNYVIRIENRIATVEEAVRAIQEKLDSNFQG